MTADRAYAVDYSRFIDSDTFTILMRTPKHFSKADSLLAPFTRNVRKKKKKVLRTYLR